MAAAEPKRAATNRENVACILIVGLDICVVDLVFEMMLEICERLAEDCNLESSESIGRVEYERRYYHRNECVVK